MASEAVPMIAKPTLDLLIILGSLYDWIKQRRLPIFLFSIIALLIIIFNFVYLFFNCGCVSPVDFSPPVPDSQTVAPNVEGLCCSFSRRHIEDLCAQLYPLPELTRGYIYKMDVMKTAGVNCSVRLAPVIVYPINPAYELPRSCLNNCLDNAEKLRFQLDGHRPWNPV